MCCENLIFRCVYSNHVSLQLGEERVAERRKVQNSAERSVPHCFVSLGIVGLTQSRPLKPGRLAK